MEATKDFRCGHRERVKNRFLREGLSPFVDYEVLELLLFFVIPRRDTKGMAHALIHRFSSLGGVLRAPAEQLCETPGIGARTAAYLRALLPFAKSVLEREETCDTLDTDQRLKAFFVSYFANASSETQGSVAAAYLNNNASVIASEMLPIFRFTEASVSVKHFAPSAFACGAASVALAHRVNSAIPFPNWDAFGLVHALDKELKGTGLTLHDTYLVAKDKAVSIRDTANGICQMGRERPLCGTAFQKNDTERLCDALSLFMSKERAADSAQMLCDKPLGSLLLMPYKKLMESYPTQGTAIYFLQVMGELLSYERREYLRLHRPVLKTADEMGEMFRSVLCGRRSEVFCLAALDRDGRLLRLRSFAEGSVTTTFVAARTLLEEAAECGAFSVAIAHNHPCGAVEPSDADRRVTSEIQETFRSIGVRFLEHFVVNEREYKAIAYDCMHIRTDAEDDFYN